MLFAKPAPFAILTCATCRNGGFVGVRACPECRGKSPGTMRGRTFLFFGEPMTRYHIALRRARQWLLYFETLGALVFVFGFLGIFLYGASRAGVLDMITVRTFWFGGGYDALTRYVWLALAGTGFLVYRITAPDRVMRDIVLNADTETIPPAPADITALSWTDIRHMHGRDRQNIANTFSMDARQALERAFVLAEKKDNETILPAHLFLALLSVPDIRGVFIRLGIAPDTLAARIAGIIPPSPIKRTPYLAPEMMQTLFRAYDLAVEARQRRVRPTELLLAAAEWSEAVQEILYDMEVDARKLANVVAWIRIREELRDSYRMFRRAASHRSKHGMDRAMTAVATPTLNAYSRDLTLLAKFGQLTQCVARGKEIEEIFRIVEGGRQNVMLVGPTGVGKRTIIDGIVERMVKDAVPKRLRDKRLVQVSATALLAGTTVAGAEERLLAIARDVRRAGNVILFIENIHDLMSMSAAGGDVGLDVSEALSEVLSTSGVFVFATATLDGFNRHIMNSGMGSAFVRVDVREMSDDQAIQVLESRAGVAEYKQRVFFSYDALESAVSFAQRFLHDQPLPESALELATEAAGATRKDKGENALVLREDVAKIVASKTGVPVTTISSDESERLLTLEEEMHHRVVGQSEAVSLVANALRRARAEIRSANRPIANFLFLGPTGVGKTELAKTIAAVYFGGEDRMIRFDMSEFQDSAGVYRLIGQPGAQGTGLMTEAVRQHPFSLILLDELEKANKDLLNVFLQVFDDGRLTDSTGRVIDFTNTIIIATSNAGTAYVAEANARGESPEQIQNALIHRELAAYYRPEFLNRFDAIVLFHPLSRDEIKHIARLMLGRVEQDLERRGVGLRVEDAALESLADAGFDPAFGARPMRRAIQDTIENTLAELVLVNGLKRRDTVVLGAGAAVSVEHPKT
jgi:ATP-dependent Clp protease ATP-binding subunit ClpC